MVSGSAAEHAVYRCCVLGKTLQRSTAEDKQEDLASKRNAGEKRESATSSLASEKPPVARPQLLVSLKPSRGGYVPCWAGKNEAAPPAQMYKPEDLTIGAEVGPVRSLQCIQ